MTTQRERLSPAASASFITTTSNVGVPSSLSPLSFAAHPPRNDDTNRTALILGGWSPGPLWYLVPYLQNELGFRNIIQPDRLLEMPPMTCGWCCRSKSLILVSSIYTVFLWWMRRQLLLGAGHSFSFRLAVIAGILCGTLLWLRMLLAFAVHTSIQHNVKVCRRILNQYHNSNESDIFVMLAFSWGGAVAAELLATLGDGGDDATLTTPSICALLVAPTTSVVASLNLFQPKDAALRITRNNVNHNNHMTSSSFPRVAVVHATDDPVFCPHPERWQYGYTTNNNIELTMLRDNHVFMRSSSERELKAILNRLLDRQGEHIM